jgi:hypothetical protein
MPPGGRGRQPARERGFAWATRFHRRLAKRRRATAPDVAGMCFVAFVCLMQHQAVAMFAAP